MALALLFPGQGAQFVGMGRELADRFPSAAATFREADEILDFPLSRLLREGPEEELVLTKNAQPAILVHSIAAYRVVAPGLQVPVMAAGHSLGEFSAHVAAGTLTFADALRAVRRRGELMYEAGRIRPGTMAALLGLEDDAAADLCRSVSRGPDSVVVPANLNSTGQVVISGDVDAVERAMSAASEAGAKRVVPLNVSGAFHSPLMAPAQEGLYAFLEGVEMKDPAFPVVSNVTARPVGRAGEARDLLVRQLTSPVRWAASVAAMLEEGVSEFLELGPGNVLSGLNRRNARGVPTRACGTADEAAALVADAPEA
jgi:[acyl-carrier-protein] S-malonyltransferase